MHTRMAQHQRGIVLVVALVMLLAVTLMVLTASNTVQTNLKVVGNIEGREQVRDMALAAIEEAISEDQFTANPDNVFAVSCDVNNRRCYDVNGDGAFDVNVDVVPPTCIQVKPKLNSSLQVFDSAAEQACYSPPQPGVLVEDINDESLCADTIWEFRATARDVATGAEVTVRQGVSVLTTKSRVDTACPT